MLKEGSDTFEKTRVLPKIVVCEQRYVFNAVFRQDAVDPSGSCPDTQLPMLAGGAGGQDIAPAAYASDEPIARQILESLSSSKSHRSVRWFLCMPPVSPWYSQRSGNIRLFRSRSNGASGFRRGDSVSFLTRLMADTIPALWVCRESMKRPSLWLLRWSVVGA